MLSENCMIVLVIFAGNMSYDLNLISHGEDVRWSQFDSVMDADAASRIINCGSRTPLSEDCSSPVILGCCEFACKVLSAWSDLSTCSFRLSNRIV